MFTISYKELLFFIMRIVYNFVKRKPSMTLGPDRYYIVISRINGWNELCVTQKIKFLKCGRCCIVIVWKYIFLCSPYFNFRDTLIILYVSNYQWKQIMDCVWSIMIYLNLCHSQLIYMKNGTMYTVVNFYFIFKMHFIYHQTTNFNFTFTPRIQSLSFS